MLRAMILACLLIPGLPTQASDPVPDYPVEKLGAHTYVIQGPSEIPNPANKGFMNNPVFVVTAVGVVVLDPGSSLEIGRMVLRQIKKITNKPVTHVFSSHIHGDHWLGNHALREVYMDARFYAHPVMIEQANAGQTEFWLNLLDRLTEGASSGTEAVIPDIALKHGQEIKTGGMTFRIHLSEWAHTRTDAMIEVIEDSVLVTGDNVIYRNIRRLDDASFRGNLKACQQALALEKTHYVPGHGPAGGPEVIRPFCTYLETLYRVVGKLYEDGLADFEMKEAVVADLAEYHDWPGFSEEVGKHISLAVLEIEQAEFE